jgi:uncharacterized membrane protein
MKKRLLRILSGLGLAGSVAILAERRGSLSPSGGVAATLIGALAFSNGWPAARELLVFFTTSTALSHVPRDGQRYTPARTATQVLANGGVASIAWGGRLLGAPAYWSSLASAALAVAAADTWATEIGLRWGGTPRRITSGQPVEAGESGGVTSIGTLGAIGGALIVAISMGDKREIAPVAFAGVLGAIADSLLGASAQARYCCSVCKARMENPVHCGKPAELMSGYAWMTNDAVNFAATLIGGFAGLGLRQLRH